MKALSRLLLLLIVTVTGAGICLHFDVEAKKQELVFEQELLDSVASKLAEAERRLSAAQEKLDALQAQITSPSTLDDLQSEVRRLEEQRHASMTDFVAEVQRVRAGFLGKVLDTVTLTTGQTLNSAKVTRLTEREITFTHANGIVRFKLAELPADLRTQLRIDQFPMEQAPLPQEPAPLPPPAPAPPQPVPARKLSDAESAKVASLERNIKTWEQQRLGLYAGMQAARKKSSKYHAEDQIAIQTGKPPRNTAANEKVSAEVRRAEGMIAELSVLITNALIEVENIKERAQ